MLNRSLADFQGNSALGTPEQNNWIFRRAEKNQVQSYAENLGSRLGTKHCKSQLSNTLMPHPHCSAFPQLGPVDLKDLLLSGAQEGFTSHPPRPRLQLYLDCDTGTAKVAVSTILSCNECLQPRANPRSRARPWAPRDGHAPSPARAPLPLGDAGMNMPSSQALTGIAAVTTASQFSWR